VLLEVWRGLKYKLTLYCASPRELQGKLWDVIDEFCSHIIEDVNKNFNTSPEAVSLSTEHKDESAVSRQSGRPSVVTITLIVVGVVLVCAVGGGVIWVSVVKGRRDRPKNFRKRRRLRSQYIIRLNSLNAAVGAVPSYVSVQSDTDVDSDSRNATGYSYAAVQ
jgi:hypothetical protein